MDRPGVLSRAALAGLVAAVALGVAACGGGGSGTTPGDGQLPFTDNRAGLVKPEPALDNQNRVPRDSSVTYNDPPPSIAPGVQAAADAAGCKVTGFQAEPAARQPDGTYHTAGDPTYRVSIPPLSGLHNVRWADWGVYDKPVPYKYQIHDLEHGGVLIHYGRDVSEEGVNALRELWAKSPAFVSVMPDTNPQFTGNAVVAGSWQRWVVCKPFAPSMLGAIKAFVDEYRGRGPEQAGASDAGGHGPGDLPQPVIPDTGAQR